MRPSGTKIFKNSLFEIFSSSKLKIFYITYRKNSLKFFNEIIKSLMNNSKLDIAVYKEAQNEKVCFFKYYIIEKMESLL